MSLPYSQTLVGQVGGAHIEITLAVVAMASRAIVGKDLLAGGDVDALFRLEACEGAHVVGDLADLVGLEDAVLAERRHRAGVRVRIVRQRGCRG